MSSRDLFELEHGDTGVALLPAPEKVNAGAAQPDPRIKRLVALSRWERAGMLAYIAATYPQVFDETYAALGLAEP